MGRPPRIDPVQGWHHVVNRGVDRRDVFLVDADRVEFGRLLGVAHDRFGVNIHAYCLMSNHFHLLVECPDGGLSDAMHVIASTYVRHFNDRVGRDGPLFRSRFFARPVMGDAAVVAVARYIHRNPLAFLELEDVIGYRWSSLRTYLEFRRSLPWLRTDVVSALCGGPAGIAELTCSSHATAVALDPEVLCHFADLAVEEHLGELASQRAARTLLTLALDRADEPAAEILGNLLEFPNKAAENAARHRARRRALQHPAFGRAVDAVLASAA